MTFENGFDSEKFYQKGTTAKDKAENAARLVNERERNARLALGLPGDKPINPAAMAAIFSLAEALHFRDHFAAILAKQEAERKAREEAAKKAAEINNTVAALAAKLGTLDPDKIIAALRALGDKTLEK